MTCVCSVGNWIVLTIQYMVMMDLLKFMCILEVINLQFEVWFGISITLDFSCRKMSNLRDIDGEFVRVRVHYTMFLD
jgi:hypothetical protein